MTVQCSSTFFFNSYLQVFHPNCQIYVHIYFQTGIMLFLYQKNGKFREEKTLEDKTHTLRNSKICKTGKCRCLKLQEIIAFQEVFSRLRTAMTLQRISEWSKFFALTASACPSQQNKTNRIKLFWHCFKGCFDSFPKFSGGFSFYHFTIEVIIQNKD